VLQAVNKLDRALYGAIAAIPNTTLDRELARLSTAADYWKLSLLYAAGLAAIRGKEGREAATMGLISLAVTAALVNAVLKPLSRRERPDRESHRVDLGRHVRMPRSRSFPSGHTAQSFAFADGVGEILPREGVALRTLAAAIGYSRVHTGVHYPSDVIFGAAFGVLVNRMVSRTRAARHRPPTAARSR
jgi:membrane-associated phospholipid phosphatase